MSNIENNALALELARLRAENAALKARASRPTKITPKVSAKGAMSVYGLGRFPITLYASQWDKLLAETESLKAFLVENAAMLKSKGDALEVPAQA